MNTPAGVCSVWFALTARNRLDILAAQSNTSPIYGKVGSAVGLKSLSVFSKALFSKALSNHGENMRGAAGEKAEKIPLPPRIQDATASHASPRR